MYKGEKDGNLVVDLKIPFFSSRIFKSGSKVQYLYQENCYFRFQTLTVEVRRFDILIKSPPKKRLLAAVICPVLSQPSEAKLSNTNTSMKHMNHSVSGFTN